MDQRNQHEFSPGTFCVFPQMYRCARRHIVIYLTLLTKVNKIFKNFVHIWLIKIRSGYMFHPCNTGMTFVLMFQNSLSLSLSLSLSKSWRDYNSSSPKQTASFNTQFILSVKKQRPFVFSIIFNPTNLCILNDFTKCRVPGQFLSYFLTFSWGVRKFCKINIVL